MAKGKIKFGDFTPRDKCNLLDLFVNNEKTLLKIYEALFPHRATNLATNSTQSNQVAQAVGAGGGQMNKLKSISMYSNSGAHNAAGG